MMLKKEIFLVFLIANTFIIHSQTPELTKKDSTIVSSWIFGIGFNIVDDSDDRSHKLFDFKEGWNAVPFPSRLSIGKYFKSGLGLEAIASYNKYKKGKIADGLPVTDDKDYYSIDSRLSYDLNKIIGETGWFDPYIGVGAGYTHSNDISRGTYNAVLGFRTWFSDRWGLDINTSGKWTMNRNYTDHLQHAVGVVYRFNIKKDLTEEGKAKLELINEENEKNRVSDSIMLANKQAEEARLLSERLEKEKEATRLAELEKEKAETRNKIQSKIDALEKIHFPFNSSSLTVVSKNTLNKLLQILNEHPKLSIEITSHTDARGSDIYNHKLSESRLKSTLDYLFDNAVENDRVVGKAFGEEKLTNECDDHVKCTELKHQQNRRSEIKIISF
ncbi:Outer membrane lipoprotein Omp16 precursor [Mariniflexile rhizosphaerae]|uniref:OmpA family protein n=1 Tax=unclassified Mariniflexile TaxID=2643887 RepID=UPI000CB0EB40|nr:OmpA family protein [Mariniflexile sp. TRM1-10]AXP82381.1 Outer membrane lipoprotein Omp16 precursor [Mariniflexile sp. TRM1-10]PLB20482.1 MAG: Outer membrane lipoprotein omp16 precursor [Flavobacteriaceae bacterium FS1-H7996/R]